MGQVALSLRGGIISKLLSEALWDGMALSRPMGSCH